MKKYILFAVFILVNNFLAAQIKLGVKAGINTFSLSDETLESNVDDFTLAVKEAQYGFHAGLFLRAKLGPILIQPELVFNSDNVDYSFEQDGLGSTIVNQKYRAIDLPVLLGVKLGPVKLMSGPVAHYQLDSFTDLKEQINADEFSDQLTYGFQAGIGIDLKKITIDIRYEKNNGKLGEALNIGGQDVSFGQSRNRIVASLGYVF